MRPYLPQGRLSEDPWDGTHPPKSTRNANRCHKKGARQEAMDQVADDCDDPDDPKIEKITAVAIRNGNGIIHTLPPPARHTDVMTAMHQNDLVKEGYERGFLTSKGRFVTRWQAARVAAHAGQCSHSVLRRADGELYSDDIW